MLDDIIRFIDEKVKILSQVTDEASLMKAAGESEDKTIKPFDLMDLGYDSSDLPPDISKEEDAANRLAVNIVDESKDVVRP
jgi:hypothetical protein